MNRRGLLEWTSRGLATCVAAAIGLPGVRFFLGDDRSISSDHSTFQRVMQLRDLAPGRPTIVPIMGSKRDAWARYDQQVVGRVWLVREPSESSDSNSGEAKVRALSGVCPHMGCQLQSSTGGKGFVCPCHRATFAVDGSRQPDPRTGERNHAPRDLDGVECRLVREDATGEWWVEVMYEKPQAGRKQPATNV
jgi:menaquinol-cytochrome c reductase iron-sulfur subunit